VTRGHVQAIKSGSSAPIDQPNTCFAPGRREVPGADGGMRSRRAAARPASRLRGGDLNGDGRLDVVTTALSAPAEVWLNDSPGMRTGWN